MSDEELELLDALDAGSDRDALARLEAQAVLVATGEAFRGRCTTQRGVRTRRVVPDAIRLELRAHARRREGNEDLAQALVLEAADHPLQTAIEPCLPMAPKRGRMPRFLHHWR
jgi:hypothetical protein